MNKLPTILVFNLDTPYKLFINSLADQILPVIDSDAVLARVVDVLHYRPAIQADLDYVKQSMIDGEGLIEKQVVEDMHNPYFSEEAQSFRESLEYVAVAAKQFVKNLEEQINLHGFYEGEFFNYEYKEIINNGTLILRRRA